MLEYLLTFAGISGKGPAVETSIESVNRIMDINFNGTFICAQEAAREFQRKGVPGSMVLIASMSAHGSNKVIYPTKGGTTVILQFTKENSGSQHTSIQFIKSGSDTACTVSSSRMGK